MSLSMFADIADILAALGVIASLIFIAMQIRQNTKAIHSQHWESVIERIAENVSRPLDPQVADILYRGKRNFENLNNVEKEIFSAWAIEYLIAVNRYISFVQEGLLSSSFAEMPKRLLEWFFKHPGVGEWWDHGERLPIPGPLEQTIAASREDAIKAAQVG